MQVCRPWTPDVTLQDNGAGSLLILIPAPCHTMIICCFCGTSESRTLSSTLCASQWFRPVGTQPSQTAGGIANSGCRGKIDHRGNVDSRASVGSRLACSLARSGLHSVARSVEAIFGFLLVGRINIIFRPAGACLGRTSSTVPSSSCYSGLQTQTGRTIETAGRALH
jgi:hypothetical protein